MRPKVQCMVIGSWSKSLCHISNQQLMKECKAKEPHLSKHFSSSMPPIEILLLFTSDTVINGF